MSQFTIEIESTSNPNIIKFNANSFLTRARSFEFANIDEAKSSPLAQELFYLPFVKTVYISQNFIAIEKFDIIDWEDVQQEVADSILEYLNAGKPPILEEEEEEKEEPTPVRKMPVSVYAESTPNPAVMKFIATKGLARETYEYKHVSEAGDSPLAKELFSFPFVKEVFISQNFVSVMKFNIVEWEEITMELREFIKKYIEEGNPIVNEVTPDDDTASNGNSTAGGKANTALEKQIVSLLDEYVKPAVARDGGNILFDSFDTETKTVKVILQGACSGCPSSTATLKNGIETLLKRMMEGKVEQVVAING